LDVWRSHAQFKERVSTLWAEYQVSGNDIWIFKEKLKMLKANLKIWNKVVFRNINYKRKLLIDNIRIMDLDDENNN